MPRLLPRSHPLMWAGALASVLLVLAGLFVGLNTNVFGAGRVCHDWLAAADVQKAVGGNGRLSSTDDSDSSCTIERSGWGFGSSDLKLTVMATSEASRFPFEPAAWRVSGDRDVIAGKGAGSVDKHGGWVLLPDTCKAITGAGTDTERPVLTATLSGGTADPAGMARLLGAAAGSLAERSGCAPATATALGEPRKASAVSATRYDSVCSLPGFKLPKVTGPRGQSVHEQTSGSLDSAWFCDLSFVGDEKTGPFTRLGIVRGKSLANSLKDTRVTRTQCGGDETYFVLDNVAYPWEPHERTATGFPSERDLGTLFVEAARRALGCG